MLKKDIKIRSSEGPQFDCHLVTPEAGPKVPAIVLASAIHGVDQDLRGIADEFASHGYIAAERDLADTLALLRREPLFNGRAAVIGFCYGGPYAILGPKRLGYDAGISCHGTQLLDFIGELEGVRAPVCIIWGDQDHAAPTPVLEAYRGVPARMKNVQVHIFPGVQHGYMMRGNSKAFDSATYNFSMERALAILEALRAAKATSAQL